MKDFPDGLAIGRPIVWRDGLQGIADSSGAAFTLPAGTVTFLLTDIEGSTRLWEAHPQEMAQAVSEHYALLCEAVGSHGGVRPVEQGEGDSVVAAFARATDAVRAALEAQRALAARSWPGGIELRVRIALHTAEAQLRDEGNYFGIALSRCARIRAIANGGQTLLSRGVHDLVVDRLPEGAVLHDAGVHRLRDLGRPEHIFALSHPDLPPGSAPLRSLDALPNNLPDHLTSFIGRERELAEVGGAMADTRMLTLTGAGGCGKTRLAAQAAADAVERFRDGVWWVELAPLADEHAVGPEIGAAVGVMPLPGQSSLEAVVSHLGAGHALIVLDNCEHLLPACRSAAEELLRRCPGASVLATSRAPLGVAGETDWRVPSLSLPTERQTEPVAAVAQSDAVRLFIERAHKVRPNFAVDESNAPAIAQICHDLDGIPLAIELAAARVRVLGVDQILEGLGDRFRLLTGGATSAMPRQQTLRASVDWSHALLGEQERLLFRRLAVFAGGWTLDAVEEVCCGEGLDRLAILDLLVSLVDKSLVIAEERDSSARYRLLETVRQYALDRLADAGEADPMRERHRDAYLARAERIAPRLEAAGQHAWLDVLDVEHANMASAFDHAILGDGAKALRMCVALTVWWKLRGRFAMADAAYRRALAAAPDDAERLRARTLWAHGYLLTYGGLYEEAVAIEGEALALARTLGDDSTAARALDVLGTLQSFPDPAGAREPLEQARELARASGDEWCFVDATQIVGYTMLMQGDTGAEAMLDEALETIERTGYPEFAAWHWGGIAWARTIAGRYEEALELLERAIAVADSVGEPVSSGVAHGSRGQVRAERGEGAAVLREVGAVLERSVAAGAGMALPSLSIAGQIARASIGELEEARPGLREWAASEMAYARALASCVLARVALGLGEAGDAAEEAQRAREVATGPLENHMLAAEATVLLARATLMDGDRAAADALAHGALDAALEGGYAGVVPPTLDVLAGAAAAEESFEEAARILAAGERAWQRLGRARWVCEQAEIEALTERIRDALGEETFGEAFREAGALSLEDALAWMRRARGTRKRPAGGWESLTPTEKQVVALVAEGLTNPEVGERMFIARGTVKMHLSHIYAKLEIRNRSELAALAARRGTQNASETVSEIAGSAATRE